MTLHTPAHKGRKKLNNIIKKFEYVVYIFVLRI